MFSAASNADRSPKRVIDLTPERAREHFLRDSTYFSSDVPAYLSFEPVLKSVIATRSAAIVLEEIRKRKPYDHEGVNYRLLANKDGRYAWRPYELMHPVLYVTLVNTICSAENWRCLQARFKDFETDAIQCCSHPLVAAAPQSAGGTQVLNWWREIEQQSVECSLDFKYLLHTDVSDCYGSIYTHSIAWAVHGRCEAKAGKRDRKLLGNQLDELVRAGREGQTNGIGQGSGLMDFLAELVLGYVDHEIGLHLKKKGLARECVKVIRYRDDYRIFANEEGDAESVLRVVAESLREVGMKLSTSKTRVERNIVEGSVKADKLAAIVHEDLGIENAKTLQKQLLRIHAFGQRYPNSGALRRFMSRMHANVRRIRRQPDDLPAQVAIATDIGFNSPAAFPAVAGVLSHLLHFASKSDRALLWDRIRSKMARVPNNGYLELWLQRIHAPLGLATRFESEEPLCKVVTEEPTELWSSKWLKDPALHTALDIRKLRVKDPAALRPRIAPREVDLFNEYSMLF